MSPEEVRRALVAAQYHLNLVLCEIADAGVNFEIGIDFVELTSLHDTGRRWKATITAETITRERIMP